MYRKLYPPNAFTCVNHCHTSNTQLHEATSDETHRPVRATSHGLLVLPVFWRRQAARHKDFRDLFFCRPAVKLPATPWGSAIFELSTSISSVGQCRPNAGCQVSSSFQFKTLVTECQLAEECWMRWQLSHVISMLKGLGYVRQAPIGKAEFRWFNAKGQFVLSSQASRVGECCNNSPMCWKPLVFNPVRGINKPQSTCWRLELWNASDQFTSNVKWPTRLASASFNERRHLYSRQPMVGKWTENGLRTPYSSMCFNRVSQCLTDNISHMMPPPKLLKDWWFTVLEDY